MMIFCIFAKLILFIYEYKGKQINYGDLYEHLCSAQYIADVLQDEHANQIMIIRQEVGDKLLKIHEDNAKC